MQLSFIIVINSLNIFIKCIKLNKLNVVLLVYPHNCLINFPNIFVFFILHFRTEILYQKIMTRLAYK